MSEWWLAYLVLGAFVGFFSGLLGIGGGSVMVPVLAFVFAANQFTPSSVLHLALGTAMATLVLTSVSSAITHHRHQAVNWTLVYKIAPGVLIGTFGGASIAGYLNLGILSLLFTLLIYFLATRMLIDRIQGQISLRCFEKLCSVLRRHEPVDEAAVFRGYVDSHNAKIGPIFALPSTQSKLIPAAFGGARRLRLFATEPQING